MPKTKAQPKKEPTAMEDDAVLSERPTIEIAGETYRLRKLGLRDVFRVARILGNGIAVLGDTSGKYTTSQTLQIMVASISRNEEEVLALIADLIDVKRDALNDAERFPMDSIITVLTALSEHQDLRVFFDRLASMSKTVPGMETP